MIATRKVFHVLVGALFAFCALYAALNVSDLDGARPAARADRPAAPYRR
jgi:hypothetical protein